MRSGVYKVIDGRVEKVSDSIPSVSRIFNAAFKDPYYSHTLGTWVDSRQKKRELMQQQGLVEYDKQAVGKREPIQAKQKKIETFVNDYITGRGVERIKLKDLREVRNANTSINTGSSGPGSA